MQFVQVFRFYLLFLALIVLLKVGNIECSSYVYLNDESYNIAECIRVVSQIDDDVQSPINMLKQCITKEEKVALKEEVLRALEYAEWLLVQKPFFVGDVMYEQLLSEVDRLIDIVERNYLTVSNTGVDSDDAVLGFDGIPLNNDEILQEIVRANVNSNLTIFDSVSSDRGNIMKKGYPDGPAVRFIHNYGIDNTCVGKRAGNFNMDSAENNTAVGTDCLRFNIVGNRNTAVGKSSLRQVNNSSQNVAVGYNALRNLYIGGGNNVAVGDSALLNQTIGSSNIAIGRNALRNCSECSSNVAIGTNALMNLSVVDSITSNSNVVIGESAGEDLSEGQNNIFLGYQAGSVINSGSLNIYVGNEGVSSNESRTIRIGTAFDGINGQNRCFMAGVLNAILFNSSVVSIDANGQLGLVVSSRRFKDDINQMNNESEMIYDLNPVSFVYKNDENATKQYGLIAEEVDQVFPQLVMRDKDGEPYTVRYEVLPVLLLNEMKKQKKDFDKLALIVQSLHNQVKRSSDLRLTVHNKARFKEDVRMDKKLYVHGKAHFDNDVEFKDAVTMKNGLTITGDVLVVGSLSMTDIPLVDLTIPNLSVTNQLTSRFVRTQSGSLDDASVEDLYAEKATFLDASVICDMAVGCNIHMVNSTDRQGNIVKNGDLFIHNKGSSNTALGSQALQEVVTGASNVAVGSQALKNVDVGSDNVAVGDSALLTLSNGSSNVAIGKNALQRLSIGNSNIAIGNGALSLLLNQNDSKRNIAIGNAAGTSLGAGSNNIYIENFGQNESYTIRIGRPFDLAANEGQQRCFIAGIVDSTLSVGVPVIIDNNGQLGVGGISSCRFKDDINQMNDESELIYDLNPVSFVYKNDETETRQYGLIAEEVDKIFPQLVVKDAKTAPYAVRYEVLPVLLLNEIKKQKRTMNKQEQDMKQQRDDIDKLICIVEDLQKKVESFMAR